MKYQMQYDRAMACAEVAKDARDKACFLGAARAWEYLSRPTREQSLRAVELDNLHALTNTLAKIPGAPEPSPEVFTEPEIVIHGANTGGDGFPENEWGFAPSINHVEIEW